MLKQVRFFSLRSKHFLFAITLFSMVVFLLPRAVGKIVFSGGISEEPESLDIYVMDDDGSNLRKLTDTPQNDNRPVWSPDGKQIAFARLMTPIGGWPQVLNIFIMDANGQNERQLTDAQVLDVYPIFLPEGERLSFLRSQPQGSEDTLYAIDLETDDLEILIDAQVDAPDWSPDGRTIVYMQGGDIYTMTATGRNAQLLLPPSKQDISQRLTPKWSPDGESVLYIEDGYDPGIVPISNRVYIHHLRARTQKALPIPKAWRVQSADWMGDSDTIVLAADELGIKTQKHGNYNIYRYHIPSKRMTQLTQLPGRNYSVDWVAGPLDVSPREQQITQWGVLKESQ